MIIHYFKTTIRSLTKYKAQSIVSIIGITIGFTAFILGGYWNYWENNFDNFHPEVNRLYAITTTGIAKDATGKSEELNQLHKDDEEYFIKSLPEIEQRCSYTWHELRPEINGHSQKLHGIVTDTSFFNLFYARFVDGGYKSVPLNKQSVILTERTARKLFGSVQCAGKNFISGNSFTIAGVIKDYPENTEFILDYILLGEPTTNHVKRYTTYIRARKNIDINALKTKIESHKSIAKLEWEQESTKNWTFNLRSPAEVHLNCHAELKNRFRNIYILSIAGLLVFISSLMNLLVLFIGQQQQKERNNSFYISMGASPASLIIKSLSELALPLIIALCLSVCLIELLFPYYQEYTCWTRYGMYNDVAQRIGRSNLLEHALLYMCISTTLFMGISLIPIIHIVRNIFSQIKSKEKQTNPPVQLRRLLIIGQVGIGSLFFISSLVLFKQLHFIHYADKGISYQNVIQVNLGFTASHNQDIRILKSRILENSYVEKVSCITFPVFNERIDWYSVQETGMAFSPEDVGNKRTNYCLYVDNDYFSLFGLQLKAGSWITEQNPNDMLINETGFKQLGYKNLLNQKVCVPAGSDDPNIRVCGVINDFHYNSMQLPISPVFFCIATERVIEAVPAQYIYIRYKPGYQSETLAHLRKVIKEIDNNEVSEEKKIIELSSIMESFNKQEETIFTLFCLLAFLCILISTFGIFSLVSLSAEQRKKEIAIRKVNGATFNNILHLFFKEYFILVVIGNAIALSIGYLLMKQWLETYAYHTPLSWWLFVLIILFTCIIVILATFRQVSNAARTNPAEAVKTE